MARKRFRWAVLAAVATIAASGAARAQGAASAAPVTAAAGAASPRAAIWAATAEYVYKDDRDLVKIQPELLRTIKSSSLQAFNLSVDAAVAVEKKKQPGPNHLLKFQELVKTTQALPLAPGDPAALVRAIVAKLGENKERMADPARARQLKSLGQQLNQLAAVASPAVPAVPAAAVAVQPGAGPAVPDPAPTAGDAPTAPETAVPVAPPAAVPAVAPVGGGAPAWVSWLALALAVLSAGLAFLRRGSAAAAAAAVPEVAAPRSSRNSFDREKDLAELVKKLVREELAKQESQPVPPTTAATVATAAGPAAMAAAAIPAATFDDVLASVSPLAPVGQPIELAVLPTAPLPAAPRLRQQFVDEAPFNNGFPARALRDQPGSYSMFVIESSEQQPEQGTFAVTGNLASHVRDHRSVLEPVCEYVGGYPAGSESRVVTLEPGHVRRRGDDWEVVQRAKVRFE